MSEELQRDKLKGVLPRNNSGVRPGILKLRPGILKLRPRDPKVTRPRRRALRLPRLRRVDRRPRRAPPTPPPPSFFLPRVSPPSLQYKLDAD